MIRTQQLLSPSESLDSFLLTARAGFFPLGPTYKGVTVFQTVAHVCDNLMSVYVSVNKMAGIRFQFASMIKSRIGQQAARVLLLNNGLQ